MNKECKVLVIDDSPFVFKAVKKALEPEGFCVVDNAPNGQVGIEMAQQYKPDLITLDVTMPVLDGIEAAKVLVKDFPDTKIIMLSAMGDDLLLNQAKELGISHFVSKPFKSDELAKVALKVLEGK